jgi:hypothetical protein
MNMTINLKVKSLIVIALLCGFTMAVTASTNKKSNAVEAEATAAEAELSFWDLPYLEKTFIDLSPEDRKDAIPVGELAVDEGKKSKLIQLAKEIGEHKHGDYDSLLISYDGKLVFESYQLRIGARYPDGLSDHGRFR